MLKQLIGAATGLCVLAACQGADPYSDFRADCDILVQDPEAQENIAEMNTDNVGFCGCMVTLVSGLEEADQTVVTTTLSAVTAEMAETGEGAEEVVGEMMRQAMMNPDSEESQAVTTGINRVGRLIDDIEEAFESGACTA